MKKWISLIVATTAAGLIGWSVIRALSRAKVMKNLRKLFGDEWIEAEVLCAEPGHLLGKWQKKNPNNSVTKYADELVSVALEGETLKCDLVRLASKLKGEFVDTLTELGYAVFLTDQGLRVTMEPTAPEAGPDLLAVKDKDYFVEVRKVRLDEAHAAADLATEDVFERLCSTPSRYSVFISMTEEFSAHSPQLKDAMRAVRSALADLSTRNVPTATLYYNGRGDTELREGNQAQAEYDYGNRENLARQVRDQEQMADARFKAQFDDTGEPQPRTAVGVLPLGPHRRKLEPDETYLRLKSILRKKQKQLPKGKPGIILLEISDLGKLMVNEFTLARTFYGDLQMVIRGGPGAEHFPHEMHRKPNGFFMGTTRVSAVVVETVTVGEDRFVANREVFPTNNPQANVLSLAELKLFGMIAEGHENLCAEELAESQLGRKE
jgi:hypothetical protein